MSRPLPADPRFRALLVGVLAACAKAPAAGVPASTTAPDLTAPAEAPGPPGEADCRWEFEQMLGGLKPALPHDGLVARVAMDGRATTSTETSAGTPCASEACTAAVAAPWEGALRTTHGQMGRMQYQLAWTQGDAVQPVAGADALRIFLGPVDSADEASLWAFMDGYEPECGAVGTADGSWTVHASKRLSDCPITTQAFTLAVRASGEVVEVASEAPVESTACIGRFPPGLVADGGAEQPGVGAWLARAAALEAASVHAFRRLAQELRLHGAPDGLVGAAEAAAADEVRHAEVVGALARANGGVVTELEVAPLPLRDLQAVAEDNAAEGCVRETFGAAIGLWQAVHASDPEVRRVMAGVAADEVRHAELSRAVHRWAVDKLGAQGAQRVERARRTARRRMRRGLARTTPDSGVLGLPSPSVARRLLDGLVPRRA
ncbi:MAG: hypothetical protein ACI9K2_003589 [Myxococcota bacterium]